MSLKMVRDKGERVMINVPEIWERVRRNNGVVGHSGTPKKKIVDGIETPELAVRIYVEKKLPLTELAPDSVIPPEIDGVKTDVVEVGELRALGEDPKKYYRPAPAGCSAIFKGGTACTLGWFARDNRDDEIVIIANNHCYPAYGEVLTKTGFKRWDSLNGDEEFATLNKEGELEYQKALKKFKFKWPENEIYRIKGANFSFSMTPGNQIFAADAWHHSSKRKQFRITTIEDLKKRLRLGKTTTMRLKRTAKWNCEDDPFFTDDIVEYLGWHLTEGSACENRIKQKIISIRQREDRYYEEIYKCLTRLTDRVWRCQSAVVANAPELHILLKELGLYGVHAKEKFIPTRIKMLPPKKLRILYDTMMKGDGSKKGDAFYSSSKQLADDFMEIALKLGIPTKIKREEGSTNFAKHRVLYRVFIHKNTEPLIHSVEKCHYDGIVYDVMVPNHTLFIRENGFGIWSGNCTCKENKLQPGHFYVQPSPYDRAAKKLGVLKRFVPIIFEEYVCPYRQFFARTINPFFKSAYNKVDLGLVSVNPDDIKLEILNIGPVQGKRRGTLGEKMMKMGRTTGLTEDGALIDNDYYGNIGYSRGTASFGPCGLIAKYKFSQGGDSSSAILCQSDRFFSGLLFAGSDSHTIFCHGDLIEDEGDVEIVF